MQVKPSPSAIAVNIRFGAVLFDFLGAVYCGLQNEAVGWRLYFDGSNTLHMQEVEG
jgi:hypothetical protein